MHIIRSGPIKPYTEVENAFAHAMRTSKPKVYSNPEARSNGAHVNDAHIDYHAANVASAQRIRQQLIEHVELYTGKPIAQFAQEVREWRKSKGKLPFPSTAYAG